MKLKNKKLIILGIICLIVISSIIGYTYSFFTAGVEDKIVITGEASSPSLALTVEKISPNSEAGLIPQLDSAITNAVIGVNGSCLDANNNPVCQVYKITLTNTSTVTTYVTGTVTIDPKSNPNLKWAQISGISNTTLLSSVNSYLYINLTTKEKYKAGESKDYYIVIWISETGESQTDSGGFTGVVAFNTVSEGVSVDSNLALTTLTNLGLSTSGGIPDFSKTSCSSECDEATVGIYASEDDLGTSYYFRGNVENNYVKFAGYYWRIIRINGDGTIRMIYDGTSAHTNGESSTDRAIGTSAFNSLSREESSVGYMFGSIASDITTNTKNSTIKDTLDSWYESNLANTTYEKYIKDAIYCNDRSVGTGQVVSSSFEQNSSNSITLLPNKETVTESNIKPIVVEEIVYFSGYDRAISNLPSLLCEQQTDRFTKETLVSEVEGNGNLTYSIGLITKDEIVMSGGGFGTTNTEYYLFMGNDYYTSTPIAYGMFEDGKIQTVSMIQSSTHVFSEQINLSSAFPLSNVIYVRPVITIDGSKLIGAGTSSNPFTIIE